MDGSFQKIKGSLMITHNFHRSRTSSERQSLLNDTASAAAAAATLTSSNTSRKKAVEPVCLRKLSAGNKLLTDGYRNSKDPEASGRLSITYIDFSSQLLRNNYSGGGIKSLKDRQNLPGSYDSMPGVRKDSFRWLLPRAPQRRLVYKNGDCNITRANINKRGQRYLADIFTTLVDIKWRWNLLIFALAFTLSWIIFGLVWWLICFSHGDLANYGQVDWKACVDNISDFSTALLFSIETQQTIGYGTRSMTPYCIEAIIMVMFQSCFGIIIQALMTGLVFAKLSRPKKRAQTLMFSKSALICDRDGELCLLFRVGDMRKSHIVEAQEGLYGIDGKIDFDDVRAVFVSKRVTREGEVMPMFQRDLLLGDGTGDGRLFLVWPIIVEHKINRNSPLWDISADDLHRRHFEIIIILEGIVESTGMTTQARTSYLPAEVLWGHRFERLVSYQRENGQYLVDYSRFNNIVSVEMSPSSAKERAAGRRRSSNDDSDDDREDTLDALPDDEMMRLSTAVGERSPSISITTASNSRLKGMNIAALAAFDLQNEFAGNGVDDFNAQINDVCQFNAGGGT